MSRSNTKFPFPHTLQTEGQINSGQKVVNLKSGFSPIHITNDYVSSLVLSMSRVWVHVQYTRVQYKVDNVNCLQSTATLCTSVAREMGVIPTFWVLKFRISTSQKFHQCLGQLVLLSAQFSFNITRFNEYVMLINSIKASCRNMFLGTSLSRRC